VDLWLITLTAGLLCLVSIHAGHDWGGDFALYIEQARSILDGTLEQLFVANKYSMDNSSKLMGPYLYPSGLPLLLAPVYHYLGLNFIVLKVFCSLFFVLSVPVIFYLFRDGFQDVFYAFFITIMIGFHSRFIYYTDRIFADLPFLFFSLSSLLLMQRRRTGYLGQCLLGVLIFYSYFTRDIGISLLPTLLTYQLFQQQPRPGKISLIIPYFVFAVLFAASSQVFPQGGGNHYEELFSASLQSFASNAVYYMGLIGELLTLKNITGISMVAAMVPILAGMMHNWKKHLYMLVYVAANLLILLIWPARQGIRFIFPVAPFLVFFWLKGVRYILVRCGQGRRAKPLLAGYLIMFTVVSVGHIVYRSVSEDTNESYTPEMLGIYGYISENVGANEIMGFKKPRVLRLFTARNAIYDDEGHFGESVATYLLIEKSEASPQLVSEYSLVHEFANYLILAKVPPSSQSSASKGVAN